MIATLPTRTLGTDGPLVSAVGLCCMGLSANYGTPPHPDAGIALLRADADRGVTFFDTAEAYGLASAAVVLTSDDLRQLDEATRSYHVEGARGTGREHHA